MFQGRVLVRRRNGTWKVALETEERELLARLAGDLTARLDSDPNDPVFRRLFPPAYLDDIAHEAEWQVFKAGELKDRLLAHLTVLQDAAAAPSLTDDQAQAWMMAINACRLVLGTILDVSEEDDLDDLADDHPDAPAMALYDYLGYLLSATLHALAR